MPTLLSVLVALLYSSNLNRKPLSKLLMTVRSICVATNRFWQDPVEGIPMPGPSRHLRLNIGTTIVRLTGGVGLVRTYYRVQALPWLLFVPTLSKVHLTGMFVGIHVSDT